MKNVIFTSSDKKYGDFVSNHWLKSLTENVDLTDIDVVVLDYGLTEAQARRISRKGAIVHKCVRDGHVTSIRFRDMFRYLKNHDYDQVMSIDGGDIIFQADISGLFSRDRKEFRVVVEDLNLPFEDLFASGSFDKKTAKDVKAFLKDKKMINAGMVLGPSGKFKRLCQECMDLIHNKKNFGPDQIAINYILHRDGFVAVDRKYNFIITTTNDGFHVRDGIFYLSGGEPIPVIHNSGNISVARSVGNFGYGKKHNQIKVLTRFGLRNIYKIVGKDKDKRVNGKA